MTSYGRNLRCRVTAHETSNELIEQRLASARRAETEAASSNWIPRKEMLFFSAYDPRQRAGCSDQILTMVCIDSREGAHGMTGLGHDRHRVIVLVSYSLSSHPPLHTVACAFFL